VQCKTSDIIAHSFLEVFLQGWQRSMSQVPGDTFSDKMSLYNMAVALKMYYGSDF